MKPVVTQAASSLDMPRSALMVGTALTTTVLSMVIMNALTATTVSVHPYLSTGAS
ncbi:hypothetical protein [Thermocatellispora tengchongensis]|uniref:hypothetical protein n=1 Tax=Thermocatellispora tengchongensis TaxID=1073253 RepID=UPI003645729B